MQALFSDFGTFFQKVFRLQLFVSIVGLAEAVPAGLQGPLRLVAPRDPGGVQSTAAGCACGVGQDGSGASLLNGREATGRDVGGGRSMVPPFAVWVQWIKHPDRFLRFIPKEPDLL